MTAEQIAGWKRKIKLAEDDVKQAEQLLKVRQAYLEKTTNAFCAACDHTHPNGEDAMSGFAYAFCEICSECGG